MFRPLRLRGIITSSLAGLAMLWLHDARRGGIATIAHAEESAPLAATAELVRRKGFDNNLHQLCDIFGLRPKCAAVNLAASVADGEEKLFSQMNYPQDLIATFEIVVDPDVGPARIILATESVAGTGTAYAFLTDVNGRLYKVALGRHTKGAKGRVWDWSGAETTQEAQAVFGRELRLWASEANRHDLAEAPDRRR